MPHQEFAQTQKKKQKNVGKTNNKKNSLTMFSVFFIKLIIINVDLFG